MMEEPLLCADMCVDVCVRVEKSHSCNSCDGAFIFFLSPLYPAVFTAPGLVSIAVCHPVSMAAVFGILWEVRQGTM